VVIHRRPIMLPVTVLGLLIVSEARTMAQPAVISLSDVLNERVMLIRQGWGELGVDTCAHAPGKTPSPLRLGDRTYDKGLGNHANGEILVDLSGEFLSFEADIGVQWQRGTTGTVVFRVVVDGEVRFDSGVVREADGARSIRVDVADADEMRLIATDAGDGIMCDCANWANPRLVLNPDATPPAKREPFDAGRYARVVTSDPARKEGCRSRRTEEFAAEDVFLEQSVAPAQDQGWEVPRWKDGVGCIGLLWPERRLISQLGIEFAGDAAPDPGGATVEFWEGESRWQGQWRVVGGEIEVQGNCWTLHPDWGTRAPFKGTEKIRWLIPKAADHLRALALRAYTRSRWNEKTLRLQLEEPVPGKKAVVEAYNGEMGQERALKYEWDLGGPGEVRVRYTHPRTLKNDRTVLRFSFPDGAVAVAMEDVLNDGVAYVPAYGLYIAVSPARLDLAAYKATIQGRDTVLQMVRKAPEQSFAQAMSKVHRPIQNNGPTMLSLACDNRKFVVDRDGTFGPYKPGHPHPSYAFRVTNKFGSGVGTLGTRHLQGGWLPVPEITAQDEGIVYRQRAFVAPIGREEAPWSHRRPLFVAEYDIEKPVGGKSDASLKLAFSFDEDSYDSPIIEAGEGEAVVRDGDRVLALVSLSGAVLELQLDGHSVHVQGQLPPNSLAQCRVLVPGWDARTGDCAALLKDTPTPSDVAAYWTRILSDGMQVRIPDALLEDVIRASQVYCLMNARNEANGARLEPWIGADRYGPLESEGHSIVLGMDLFGHHDFARRCLDFYIRRYNEAGYLTTGYTMMGTGQHLWTLAEHYRLARDTDWLRGKASEIARVCRWLMAQRKKTQQLSSAGEHPPECGLIPPGVIADWNRYAYRFYMEAYYCAGLRAGAEILSDLAIEGAEEIAADAKEFSRELDRAYHWSQARTPGLELSNGAIVPGVPAMLYCFGQTGEVFPGEDWGRSWAGDVGTGPHHLAALEVLDPNCREAEAMAEVLEDYWFLHDGMGDYPAAQSHADPFNLGGFSKTQPYYGRLNHVYALRDEVKPFIRSYFNPLPSLLNLENLSLWEHFHNRGGWNKTHETGWFLARTRDLFLMERGDELWLAPFVTIHWMAQGMAVEVDDAPTKFGRVSYEIRAHPDEGFIQATVEPPSRETPSAIVLRLRHAEGKPMRSVTVNGQEYTQFDAERETIRLPPGAEVIKVRARY